MTNAETARASNADRQAMFFRSDQVSAHWDAWMYQYAGVFYLYYLVTERSPGEGFGVATSQDGVNWTDHGWALFASDEMEIYLGTGSVWKAVDFQTSGRFICNYSEHRPDGATQPQQRIYFAWSEDLIHWTKYGDQHDFRVDTQNYEQPGRWDCIYAIPKEGGGYHGYWTANPIGRVGFGYGQSDDGVSWKALPAPALHWGDGQVPESMEAGAVKEVQGRYYALTGQPGLSVRTMVGSAPGGPFRVASKNYRLLENPGNHKHAYFPRFFCAGGELLVNHHAITRMQNEHGRPVCYLAPLKKAVVDDGTLWLKYWPGNDKLKRVEVALAPTADSALPGDGVWLFPTCLPTDDGIVLEGRVELVSRTGGDGVSDPGIDSPEATRQDPGLLIETAGGVTSHVVIRAGGTVEFGTIDPRDGTIKVEDVAERGWPFGESAGVRLLLKHSVLEFDLDDVYIQSYSLHHPASGRIGLTGGDRGITNLRAWKAVE